jgi:hypothetical protein
MTDARKVGPFEDNCCEIQLSENDRASFELDESRILLELRPHSGLYGVFYSAKGRQWDVWSDLNATEVRGIQHAVRDPAGAACELLSHEWRPDFEYDPDADD